MKHAVWKVILLLCLSSCIHPVRTHLSSWSHWKLTELDTIVPIYNPNIDSLEHWEKPYPSLVYFERTKECAIDQNLPFGSDILTTYTFPVNGFETYLANRKEVDSTERHAHALLEIWKYYLRLVPSESEEEVTPHYLPTYQSIQGFANPNLASKLPDKLFSGFDETYTFRLPDLGRYETYYRAHVGDERDCFFWDDRIQRATDLNCESYGILIFYDRKRQHVIWLMVQYWGWGEWFNFFNISKNRIIHIYEGSRERFGVSTSLYGDPILKLKFDLSLRYELRIRRFGRIEIRVAQKNE